MKRSRVNGKENVRDTRNGKRATTKSEQRFERPNRKIYGLNGPWSRLNNTPPTPPNPNQMGNKDNKVTRLYHFSLYRPPLLAKGNFIRTQTPTWYQTNHDWRYFGRNARGALVVEIPTAELKMHGVPSNCHCSEKNGNEKCYITWVLPPFYGAFDMQNNVLLNKSNNKSQKIPRQHVKWIGASNKLTIQSNHNKEFGMTYFYVGNDPMK